MCDERDRRKFIVLRLIAEISAINDLPSLLCKAREINAKHAGVLRAGKNLLGFLIRKKNRTIYRGREYVNTRSWRIITRAMEKKCKTLVAASKSRIILRHLREILHMKPSVHGE